MPWILPAIAAASAVASAGAGIAGAMGRNNNQQIQGQGVAEQQLRDAQSNQQYQRAVSALINQRSIAGTRDSFGTNVRYDPATNQWVSQLGPLPQAAQTAADQAGITRNTTDLQNVEMANREAMKRAALAAPGADTAQRNLQQFRPTTSDELTGLLQERATTANNETFRPLIADTLRSMARTGTAAGPVLAQLGRTSADATRKGLIESQIAGMTNTDQINQQRRQGLETSATTGAALANPAFQFSGIQPSGAASALQTAVADRAKTASSAPATGQFGVNQATALAGQASQNLGKNIADPNFGLNSLTTIGKEIGTLGDKKGPIAELIGLFGGPSTNEGDAFNKRFAALGGDSFG